MTLFDQITTKNLVTLKLSHIFLETKSLPFFLGSSIVVVLGKMERVHLVLKTAIDYRLIEEIVKDQSAHNLADFLPKSQEVSLDWPGFLACFDMRSILEYFPPFNEQNKIFLLIKEILQTTSEKDLIMRLYDQIFVECLTQVKALLADLTPNHFLSQIEEKKRLMPFLTDLDVFGARFASAPYEAFYDLTFYLGWDRVCVWVASLFDGGFSSYEVFKECLVESFVHITDQAKTKPGFFRLLEALYSYYLREEKIQEHTPEEFQILSQASIALKPREELISLSYVESFLQMDKGRALTLDSKEKVEAALGLARLSMEKLAQDPMDWPYHLSAMDIVCLEKNGDTYSATELSFTP